MTALKIKYGDDIRRISLGGLPSFEELYLLVKNAFGSDREYVIKYEDDEFDLVSVSSDEEVKQAALFAADHAAGVIRFEVEDADNAAPMVLSQQQKPPQPQQQQALSSSGLLHALPQLFDVEALKRIFCHFDIPDFVNKLTKVGLLNATQEQAEQLVRGLQSIIADASVALKHSSGRIQSSEAHVHEGVYCDGCQSKIIGVRYKCAVCFNYDLCGNCEAAGMHDIAHPRVKIVIPVDGVLEQCAWTNAQGVYVRLSAQQVHGPDRDNTIVVTPSRLFVKTWKIKNNGTRSWPPNTALAFVGGSILSAVGDIPILIKVAVDQEVDISVEMVAPTIPGKYQSCWCMRTPEGIFFGEKLWAMVDVLELTPPPTPSFIHEETSMKIDPPLKELRTTATNTDDPLDADSMEIDQSLTVTEKESLKVLHAMGFTGDLISIFRKNRCDIVETLNELIVE